MYYPYPKESYQLQSFLRVVLQALARCCPLCGKAHAPKLHQNVRRSYRDPGKQSVVWISVPRIICSSNKARKRAGKASVQYTRRVLPGFLIPYSRVVVDAVQGALRAYLGQQEVTEDGAALRMGCLNVSSFCLFYRRVLKRITAWISFIGQVVVTLGGTISSEEPPAATAPLPAQWAWYTRLALDWQRLHDRQPGCFLILRPLWWQYVYAALARQQMGLGP